MTASSFLFLDFCLVVVVKLRNLLTVNVSYESSTSLLCALQKDDDSFNAPSSIRVLDFFFILYLFLFLPSIDTVFIKLNTQVLSVYRM